jgi:hypothetical protein
MQPPGAASPRSRGRIVSYSKTPSCNTDTSDAFTTCLAGHADEDTSSLPLTQSGRSTSSNRCPCRHPPPRPRQAHVQPESVGFALVAGARFHELADDRSRPPTHSRSGRSRSGTGSTGSPWGGERPSLASACSSKQGRRRPSPPFAEAATVLVLKGSWDERSGRVAIEPEGRARGEMVEAAATTHLPDGCG